MQEKRLTNWEWRRLAEEQEAWEGWFTKNWCTASLPLLVREVLRYTWPPDLLIIKQAQFRPAAKVPRQIISLCSSFQWLVFRLFWSAVAQDTAEHPSWRSILLWLPWHWSSSGISPHWIHELLTGWLNSTAHSSMLILLGCWSFLSFLLYMTEMTTFILIISKLYLHSGLYIQLPTEHCL